MLIHRYPGRLIIGIDRNCPKATTTIQSGERYRSCFTTASSLILTGCIICNPNSRAASFTGEGQGVLLLPLGLSGCVTTAIILCVDVAKERKLGTANSGVPIKTTFIV